MQWLEYGILPRAGGLDDQPAKFIERMSFALQEREYRRYLNASKEEKELYKPRPAKQDADDPLAEF